MNLLLFHKKNNAIIRFRLEQDEEKLKIEMLKIAF